MRQKINNYHKIKFGLYTLCHVHHFFFFMLFPVFNSVLSREYGLHECRLTSQNSLLFINVKCVLISAEDRANNNFWTSDHEIK